MENKKIIELTEKEQKDLFCAAWHLTNFVEDYKEGKIASFTTSCETCKYQKECFKDGHFSYNNAFEPFITLTKLTGVIFSPAEGTRNSINLFNEKLIEDFKTDTAPKVPVQEQSDAYEYLGEVPRK